MSWLGCLDLSEDLKAVARELGENMSDEELQEMIREADKDDDGEVSEEAAWF